ncbi:DNA translocase FtsK 4TM domain-containing protein [Veillonella sp.]|uniref:FtsK/SpoIIIE family DNA translocase n=1 Tax=Veillonella sp. TaxID=1926307 RepID=UPI002911E88B|nr:DNA translocase FtsK 4TM domain-containing protein [Veillonella sp.]MDU3514279.1 DNA translocase FtsK 4TM domain-containing protein [Veillonella sp.]MDU5245819.1 DNA translocase FtsK 4TM domain-containing protein [Veillonella sp.]MDU6767914.1 DNA translocase FtsK 4TM domain-containing protein [Veillonella sp.]MDU6769669.1 DNA translocase FtsK 4TM domain-containing protein [Veillonella sp.]
MAEEKKTSTRGRKPRKKRATPAPKKEGFSLRNEVKGIIVIGVAILALLGFFGFDLGIVGEILTGIFRYGFGFGGIIPCIAVLWLGWRLLYQGKFMSITRRGLLITVFYLLAITMVPLCRVPVGDELATTALADQGGVVGGFLASFIRTMFGEVGSIIVVAVLMLCCGLLITRLSLGNGLRKAADKTQEGLDKAKEVAVEKVAVAKEVIEDWNEQRKEAAQRKAYDREKDTRYTDAAQNAVETLENRGVVAANDDYEVEPIDTHTPSSWKELAELEARNRAAERLVQISEESGDVVDNGEIRTDSMDDEPKSMPAWLHNHDEEHADIEEFDTDDSVENDAYGTNESGPAEYSYQPTTIGPLETNHAAIASAVPGSGAAASSVSAGAGMSSMPLSVPSLASTAEDTAQVAVSKDGQIHRTYDRPYHFPSLDILAKGEVGQNNNDEVAYNAMRLEDVLSSFGISAKVVNATQGPTVTRYEIEPAQGVKVSRIVNLTDDIALNLAAQHIRMEAPIPGKSAIGIEVPNTKTEAVHLRDVLDCSDFKEARGGIPVGLGKDIAGKPVITDLAKMPHLLVAGTTGSGKSVCVNTLISSILFSRKPEEVKLLLIDPKMVELSVYNGIPHLMAPVVTDMKKAAAVLRWAVREMEARYKAFAASGKRDIKSYNEAHPKSAMPLIVLIIDELADLMMTAPDDIEESISRLAQMARAAGIHMVLATQRPSVNVITGSIKANVPSRISFAVGSQIDSRTILDMAGAEKLLGKGDMLFSPIGANKPIRVQGAFISDDEVEHLVEFVKQQREPEYDDTVTAEAEKEIAAQDNDEQDIYRDELLERAVNLVMESGQASVSMLQRRFRIGYTRAARLVDTMEDLKIVGPNMGSKAREILMSPEQVKARYFSDSEE